MFWKKKQAHWVDEFIANVREYITVRPEDNLLIKRPNQATKLNDTGVRILHFLLSGGTYSDLLKKAGEEKESEIQEFILVVKGYLEGKFEAILTSSATEEKPFDMKFSDYPVLSELAITYKCNLKCKFCYAGCNCTANPVDDEKELDEKAYKKLIDGIAKDAKVPSISFTGGEPTLRPDLLLKLISYAKQLDMRVNLISNGTKIDREFARKLKKAGLDSAQISLEGVSAEVHDKLVAKTGAFEKCVQSIAFLKEEGIHVHTNTTLTRLNLEEAKFFPQFIKSLGNDKFSMNLVIPTGSTVLNDELVIPYQEIGDVLREINAVSKTEAVEFMWYSPVPMCMFNTIIEGLGNKGCAACDGLLSIAPNGEILPCASYDEPVGNMYEKGFKEVWHSKECKHYRDKSFAHEFCKTCEHFHICNGACPLYWRNQGYEELNTIIEQRTKAN